MTSEIPYDHLNPDLILNAVDSVGYRSNGSLLSLNSYENRVYQIGIEDAAPIIAKFYRPNRWSDAAILEEHEFLQELAINEIPVVPPLSKKDKTLHKFEEFRFALFPRFSGRPLEIDNETQLTWMGHFIGRMHAISSLKNFQHRTTINLENNGYSPFRFILENNFLPPYLVNSFQTTVESLLEDIKKLFAEVGSLTHIRLHGDCHPGNVLWNDLGPHIVDLDDACMGPAIQDIWMLLSGDRREAKWEFEIILEGYEKFHHFSYKESYLIEAFRALRMIYYAGWIARRWKDPAFPYNFPWFNTPAYWEELIRNIHDQHNQLTNLI